MPHPTEAKQIAKVPLWRGEGNGRRRESSRRTAEENRYRLRPGGKGDRGQFKDTPGEDTVNLVGQAATRLNAWITTIVDPQPDIATARRFFRRAIRGPLALGVDHAARPGDAIQIDEHHRLHPPTRSRRGKNQPGLLADVPGPAAPQP